MKTHDTHAHTTNRTAELAVAGAILIDPNILTKIDLTADDFTVPICRMIFEASETMTRDGRTIDPQTVTAEITQDHPDAEITPEALREMMREVDASSHAGEYARLVKEAAVKRKLLSISEFITTSAGAGANAQELADGITERLQAVENGTQRERMELADIIGGTLERISEAAKHPDGMVGIPTGIKELDKLTHGLQEGKYYVLAARPGMGKTAFALMATLHAAMKRKKKIAFFTMEMDEKALMQRLLAMQANVPLEKIITGNLTDDEWERIATAAELISGTDMIIDFCPGMTAEEFARRARRYVNGGAELIIVDYLQLMTTGRRIDSRQQEITHISMIIRQTAGALQVPVLILSQLNRSVEERQNKRPVSSDIRESGAIEQDADAIFMLYRDDYYYTDSDEPGVVEIIITKNRSGRTGTVKAAWLADRTTFGNIAYENFNPDGAI